MSSTRLFAFLLSLAVCLPSVAQRGSTGGAGSTGGSTGARTTPSVTPTTPQPGTNMPNIQNERQILYISGSVVMAQGGAPPEPVAIERVCGGNSHKEGYTDSKGRYQIQLGQNYELQDVSETNAGGPFGTGPRTSPGNVGGLGGVNPRDLLGCELRGLLPGFQSSNVMIRVDGSFGEIRMDTIVLQPLGGGSGSTISLTSMQAPGGARHAFDKAEKAVEKDDLKGAEKELNKAVQEYPKFAAAWALLGMVHQSNKQLDEATKDFNQAIAADPQYAKPYLGLAVMSAEQKNWKETLHFTDELTRLAPQAYPESYFYSGVAHYNLGNMDDAEKNMRKFLTLDTSHRRPIAALYLGDILARKQDFAGAAEQARAYLALAPNASNADTVREKLKQMEQLSGTAQKQ
ncbi:MAG: tetratricopeptide repeat protein [Acidobacteria bacterium]|nr:tetratricopeptide repeat protein [Acidobacteriota bacterium]